MPQGPPGGYLPREVDRRLYELARQWLGAGLGVTCVAVQSAPGRGNSSVLDHLARSLSKDAAFQPGTRIVRVGCGTARPDAPEPELGPLAHALYQQFAIWKLSAVRRVQRRLRAAGAARLVVAALAMAVALAISSLFYGLHEYLTSIDRGSGPLLTHLSGFASDYLPRRWPDFPVWCLSGSLIGLPIYVVGLVLARKRLLGEPSEVRPDLWGLQHFGTDLGLVDGLEAAARGKRRLVVLVDDAHWLPPKEAFFLERLHGGGSDPAPVARLRTRYSILIVALCCRTTHWLDRLRDLADGSFHDLSVRPFTLMELEEIAAHHDLELPREERARNAWLGEIEQSGSNVKSLLSRRSTSLADEVAAELQELRDAEIEGGFGLPELVIYQTARGTLSISRKDLRDEIEGMVTSGHLEEVRLRRPESLDRLTSSFERSSLVARRGQEYLVDAERSAALASWLEENEPGSLGPALYYWSRRELGSAKLGGASTCSRGLDPRQRLAVKRGGWYASRLGALFPRASDVLDRLPGLPAAERGDRARATAQGLLSASEIRGAEGDAEEASQLAEDALEWLPRSPQTVGEWSLVEAVADRIWRCYWRTGSAALAERLRVLAAELPELRRTAAWRVHERHLHLRQGSPDPGAAGQAPGDPDLGNLHALTDTLWEARRSHGFVDDAVATSELVVPEPVAAFQEPADEHSLWDLAATAAYRRGDAASAGQILERWRARMDDTAPGTGDLGERALASYAQARWHHLKIELEATEEGEDPRREAEGRWETAREAYREALQIAGLLGWRPLVVEAGLQIARLLADHTPPALRTQSPPWWRDWDALLVLCLETEAELGWRFQTPAIHRFRYEFFRDLDREYSVDHAYDTFVSMQEAAFPNPTLLAWHGRVCAYLNNYGDSDRDRKRSARLFELWARSLCHLEEARPFLEFPTIPQEQANALLFAAQALRLARDLDGADELLDEAFRALRHPDAESQTGEPATAVAGASEDPPLRSKRRSGRDLMLSLRMQQAWVREAQGKIDEYRSRVRAIWRDLRPGDSDCVITLASMVTIEHERGKLGEPWPEENGDDPRIDPDNETLSLPESWFAGSEPARVTNRFEFRFLQLLSLIRLGPHPEPLTLQICASTSWWGLGKSFAERALQFAVLGTLVDLEPRARETMVHLLESIRFYFARVDEVDRQELEALRLLMRYEGETLRYRVAYVQVLCEYEYLLKRELELSSAGGRRGWLRVVERIDRYLSLLVDPERVAEWMGRAFDGDRDRLQRSLQDCVARRGILERALQGPAAVCDAEIREALPERSPPWVLIEDLEILDLWIRRLEAKGRGESPEVEATRSDLRRFALRYIRQYTGTIPEIGIQKLALDLLGTLGEPGLDALSPTA